MNLLYRLHDPALPFYRLDPRRELTHVLVALMEAMWIAPWFAVIFPGAQMMAPQDLLTYVALNMLIALLLVRILDSRGMWENLRQLVFLLGMAIAVLWAVGVMFPPDQTPPVLEIISDNVGAIRRLSIPPLIPALVLVSLVWWRGLRLALVTPTPIRVAFGMRLGIIMFFASALIPQAQQVTLTALPPFFFFGLLGISFARALSLRELSSQSATFGPRWAGFMVLSAVGITALGLVIAAIVGGLDPETFAAIVEPIISGTIFLVAFLMTPIFLVTGALIEAIVNALTASGALEDFQIPEVVDQIQQGDPNQQVGQLEQALRQVLSFIDRLGGVQFCLSVLIVLGVVLLIVLTLRRQSRSGYGDPEEREDLEGDALAGLRDMLRRGRDALNNALQTVSRFGFGRDLLAALTVRRVYAQMARLAAEDGHPRAASQTPYEYQSALEIAYPDKRDAIATITEAYVRVRYGEVPETPEALQMVVQALETFKAAET
ncbi:MAG: DUF4129 domain-containing protein [Anaerolineae bacterium]